jgi:hypothetical protein
MAGFLRVNQTIHSWNSCLEKIDNQLSSPTSGKPWAIVALDFEEKRERKLVHRNRQDGRPAGYTEGKYEVTSCSLKMLRASAQDLIDYCMLPTNGNGSYGDASLQILLQISEPVPRGNTITYVLNSAAIQGVKESHEEGIDELVTEFDLKVLTMTRNGAQLWSAVRALPGDL